MYHTRFRIKNVSLSVGDADNSIAIEAIENGITMTHLKFPIRGETVSIIGCTIEEFEDALKQAKLEKD